MGRFPAAGLMWGDVVKGRALRAFLVERDGPASILDVGQSLVDFFAARIAHSDHCRSRPFLEMPDFRKRSEKGAGLVLGFIEVWQFHTPLVVGPPPTIVDIKKVPRHSRSDPARTEQAQQALRGASIRVPVEARQSPSGDRGALVGTGIDRGHLSQSSGNDWLGARMPRK